MNKELAVCPCGQTPTALCITDNGQGLKWAGVTGNCCGEWGVEFRTQYNSFNSDECMELAIEAWNTAARDDYLTGVYEAHGLLQINPENRCEAWEKDRQEWLDEWEPVIGGE